MAVQHGLSLVCFLFTLVARTFAQCPAIAPECFCDYNSRDIICTGGNSTTVPPFAHSSDLFAGLSLHNIAIEEIQPRAFVNIKVRTITIQDSQLTRIHPDAFVGLENHIEAIIIRQSPLSVLQSQTFANLTRLNFIQIEQSGLQMVENGAFVNLPSLTYLSLFDNRLSALPDEAFRDLTALKTLVLDRNSIPSFSPNQFRDLTSLEYLSFPSNQLRTLPLGAFSSLVNLKKLLMSFNQLIALPSSLLRYNNQLVDLQASENQLEAIPEELFFYCRSLTTLDLSHNRIRSIANFPFRGQTQLTSLRLDNNLITRLPAQVYEHQELLETLHMENNHISQLEYNCLTGLYHLKSLSLQFNNITSLPFGIFDPLGLVVSMNLSHNGIREVEADPFISNRFLEILDMSYNQIRHIQVGWFRRRDTIRHLDLSYNKIHTIANDTFYPLTQLEALYLHENRIYKPQGHLFLHNPKLTFISLSRNPLVELPESMFQGPGNLKEIHLDLGCLEKLTPNVFDISGGSDDFSHIYLQNNFINDIPYEAFRGLNNRTYLDLSYNNISVIEDMAFSFLLYIHYLNLSHNALSWEAIAGNMDFLRNIVELDVSYNALTRIDLSKFDNLGFISNLYTASNPIQCDCFTAWLREHTYVSDLSRTVCASPERIAGQYAVCYEQDQPGCPIWPSRPEVITFCATSHNVSPNDSTSMNFSETTPSRTHPWYDGSFCFPIDDTPASTVPPLGVPAPIAIVTVKTNGSYIFVTWSPVSQENQNIQTLRLIVMNLMTNETREFDDIRVNQTSYTVTDSVMFAQEYKVCMVIVLLDGTLVQDSDTCGIIKTPHNVTYDAFAREEQELPILALIIASSVCGFIIIMIIIIVSTCSYSIRKRQREEEKTMPYISNFNFSGNLNEQMVEQSHIDWDVLQSDQTIPIPEQTIAYPDLVNGTTGYETSNGSDSSTNVLVRDAGVLMY